MTIETSKIKAGDTMTSLTESPQGRTPRCCGDIIYVQQWSKHWVECDACDKRSAKANSRRQAIISWNRKYL